MMMKGEYNTNMKHLAEYKVKEILKEYPETRDSDKLLILKVWESEGLFLSDDQRETFLKLTSSETIRRTRQKLQEQGYYKSTQRVKDIRMKKEIEMRQDFMTKDSDWDFTGPYPVLKTKIDKPWEDHETVRQRHLNDGAQNQTNLVMKQGRLI